MALKRVLQLLFLEVMRVRMDNHVSAYVVFEYYGVGDANFCTHQRYIDINEFYLIVMFL